MSELKIRMTEYKDLYPLYESFSDEEGMKNIKPSFTLEKIGTFLISAGLSDEPFIYFIENKHGIFVRYVFIIIMMRRACKLAVYYREVSGEKDLQYS